MQHVEAEVSGHGRVIGIRAGDVLRFSAIPYAQSPEGDLRWRAPEPARWSGTLDATRPGPIAPQLPSRLRDAMGDIHVPQSEDCLHLSIWTPGVDTRARPVVVWLHGGAWQSGGGALDWYSGARLAARGDVVVVAVNYRLAMLGWLYLEGETANVGLLDQEAALRWVKRHIAAFGGDPGRITVMGQSAGAMSAACLLARQPEFERVILQSTPLGRNIRTARQAQNLGAALLQALGVSSLDAARTLPVEALLKAQQAPAAIAALQAENEMRSLFGPVADGQVLPVDAAAALRGASTRADVLIGYMRDEMRAFPGMEDDPASPAIGERLFGEPSHQWARDATRAGRNAWVFRFDLAPTRRFGACHCIELPFVFDTLDAFGAAAMLDSLQPKDAAHLCRQVQDAWIAFVRGDSPGWAPSPETRRFDSSFTPTHPEGSRT